METFNTYQKRIQVFDEYPDDNYRDDIIFGICSEAGEVAGLAKKIDRDSITDGDYIREQFIYEAGDVLWYLARLASWLNIPFSEIADKNIEKLDRRKKDGTIHGNGSDR